MASVTSSSSLRTLCHFLNALLEIEPALSRPLASPLRHARFRVERVVPCVNSWGDEDAFVNVVADDDDETLPLRLEVASSGTTRYTWT